MVTHYHLLDLSFVTCTIQPSVISSDTRCAGHTVNVVANRRVWLFSRIFEEMSHSRRYSKPSNLVGLPEYSRTARAGGAPIGARHSAAMIGQFWSELSRRQWLCRVVPYHISCDRRALESVSYGTSCVSSGERWITVNLVESRFSRRWGHTSINGVLNVERSSRILSCHRRNCRFGRISHGRDVRDRDRLW